MNHFHIVILGLSITSSWGNGHATTYRSLAKALASRGHQLTFFEKDVPWYAANRDLPEPPYCRTVLYRKAEELADHGQTLREADLIVLGSYVPDGETIAGIVKLLSRGCFVFYDIDTPVTLTKLARGDYEYLHPRLIPIFDMYWSFTGGPILVRLETRYGARRALPLYCSVDPDLYYPERTEHPLALGYLGTYSSDRQPTLDELLVKTALAMPEGRFCVAGAQYPVNIEWPDNVEVISHIPPFQHRGFYTTQRFTLNVTRRDMIDVGYSPSVRLFEAGACGTPIISDYWPGLEMFFQLGSEILVARSSEDVRGYLAMGEGEREKIAERFRRRVLAGHTATHRALQVEQYLQGHFGRQERNCAA